MTVSPDTIDLTHPGASATDGKSTVVALKTGFMMTWIRQEGAVASVITQRFDAAGKPVGAEVVVAQGSGATYPQGAPDVVDMGGGKFGVIWQASGMVKGAVFDSATGKAGAAFDVAPNAGHIEHEITAIGNGKFALLTHSSAYDPAVGKMTLKESLVLLDARLKPVGTSQEVYSVSYPLTAPEFFVPAEEAIVANGKGGAVIYRDHGNDQLYVRNFDASGKLGAKMALNTTRMEELTAFDATSFRVETAELAKGGYVATWASRENHDDALDFEIRARVFDEKGNAIGRDFLVNVDREGGQFQPDVVALKDGGFAIGWTKGGIAGQPTIDHCIRYFDASGKAISSELITQHYDMIKDPGSGNFMLGDVSYAALSDGSIVASYGSIFQGAPIKGDGVLKATFGTSAADNVAGSNKADLILAGAGGDKVRGRDGDDVIDGFDGNDRLSGDAGNDTLIGGAGRDKLTGGEGADVFVFDRSSQVDTVVDFKSGEDKIDVRAFHFGSQEQVMDLAEQAGRNVVIHLDANTEVVLLKTTLAALAEGDFLI